MFYSFKLQTFIKKIYILSAILFTIIFLNSNQVFASPKVEGNGSYHVTSVTTSKGNAVIGNFDGRIRLVDSKTNKITLLESVHKKEIISLSSDSMGKYLLSSGSDDLNVLWDLNTLKPIKRILKPGMGIRSSRISQDGKYIYLLYPYALYIYDVNSWETVAIIDGFKDSLYSLDINFNSKFAAIGSKKGNVYIIDLDKTKLIKTIKAGNELIISLDFASENNSLAAGSYDNTVKLIDINNGNISQEFSFFQDAVRSVILNKNGTKGAFASSDGNILFYDFKNNTSFGKFEKSKNEIIYMAVDDNFKYAIIGVGTAYNEERYALLIYPELPNINRKIYFYQDSNILITENGYISAIGNFGNKITSYKHGNIEDYQTIINKYMNPKNLIVNY